MAVNKVIYGSEVLIDLTDDTVNASSLKQGYTAHDCHGNLITGTHVESGGSSGAGLPDTIEAGDTPIWSLIKYITTRSDTTSSSKLDTGSVRFKAPKAGTYRFKLIGWTNATSGSKASIEFSSSSNKYSNPSTGKYEVVSLPYSNATNLYATYDLTLEADEKIWFFGKTATGAMSGITGAIGKIYAIEVCISWDNGTN